MAAPSTIKTNSVIITCIKQIGSELFRSIWYILPFCKAVRTLNRTILMKEKIIQL